MSTSMTAAQFQVWLRDKAERASVKRDSALTLDARYRLDGARGAYLLIVDHLETGRIVIVEGTEDD